MKKLRHLIFHMLVIAVLAIPQPANAQIQSTGCQLINDPMWDGLYNGGIEIIDVNFLAGETIRIRADFPVHEHIAETVSFFWKGVLITTGFPGEITYQFKTDVTITSFLGWEAQSNFSPSATLVTWNVSCAREPLPATPIPSSSVWGLSALTGLLLLLGLRGLRNRKHF